MARRRRKVLALGDMHAPWHSARVVNKVIDLATQWQPDVVVQVGDLYDFYFASRYPKSLNLYTPVEEVRRGRLATEDLWGRLRRRCPRAKGFQLRGNHDTRLEDRVEEKCPEASFLLEFANHKGLWDFPGVTTIMDPREELEIDGVLYQHGHQKAGAHVRWNGQSTVVGHLHKSYTLWEEGRRGEPIFEFNVATIADLGAPVFQYTPQKRHKMMTGVGLIEDGSPRFVPL